LSFASIGTVGIYSFQNPKIPKMKARYQSPQSVSWCWKTAFLYNLHNCTGITIHRPGKNPGAVQAVCLLPGGLEGCYWWAV
jgi:hypothetical protein